MLVKKRRLWARAVGVIHVSVILVIASVPPNLANATPATASTAMKGPVVVQRFTSTRLTTSSLKNRLLFPSTLPR